MPRSAAHTRGRLREGAQPVDCSNTIPYNTAPDVRSIAYTTTPVTET